jgi:hypothetical protein
MVIRTFFQGLANAALYPTWRFYNLCAAWDAESVATAVTMCHTDSDPALGTGQEMLPVFRGMSQRWHWDTSLETRLRQLTEEAIFSRRVAR